MRPNPLKRNLEEGGIALGTMVFEFATPGVARIAASAGTDFVVFDQEHSGWGIETIRMLMATARAAEVVPLVRVPSTQHHFISRPLDVGASASWCPWSRPRSRPASSSLRPSTRRRANAVRPSASGTTTTRRPKT